MKPGDIVELIDEDRFDGQYRGRMAVIEITHNNIKHKPRFVRCAHPDYEWVVFDIDELVVMGEDE